MFAAARADVKTRQQRKRADVKVFAAERADGCESGEFDRRSRTAHVLEDLPSQLHILCQDMHRACHVAQRATVGGEEGMPRGTEGCVAGGGHATWQQGTV